MMTTNQPFGSNRAVMRQTRGLHLFTVTAFAIMAAQFVLPGAHAAEGALIVAGITESMQEVALSSSVAGIINAEGFKEGSLVKAGDPVVELDRKLEELEVTRRKLIVDIRKSDFEGTEKLFKNTRGTSKEELEKKETEYRVAVVEHDTAIEQLRKRYIVAPFDGHITEILLHPGESCQPYQPVVRMVDTRRCYFVSNIDAKVAAGLTTNQTVRLEVETGAAPAKVEGKISFLSPIADPASGLVKIKVLFANLDGRIRPGLSGVMLLTKPTTEDRANAN